VYQTLASFVNPYEGAIYVKKLSIFLATLLLFTLMNSIAEVSGSVKHFKTISIGDTGKRVFMIKRSFNIKPLTNRYSHKAKVRVKQFQRDRGLKVTGRVDEKTYNKIVRRWDGIKENRSEAYERIMRVARNQFGDPYVYGADGPGAFDCSGLTKFTYGRATGINLYHQASAQSRYATRISRSEARKGDLVFFYNSSGVYHTSIYAGRGRIIHASTPGTNVHRSRIWTNSVYYGRVFKRYIPTK
jgi:cell wall-associated NlpC family hydrolase